MPTQPRFSCLMQIAATLVSLLSISSTYATDVKCRWPNNDDAPKLDHRLIQRPAASFLHFQGSAEYEISTWSPQRAEYRVCLDNQSYEVGIFSGRPSVGGKLLTTIPPGSCTDIAGTAMYAKYSCSLAGEECKTRKPLDAGCVKDGRVVIPSPYWIRGWSVAAAHFNTVKTANRTQLGPDGYVSTQTHPIASFPHVRIATLFEAKHYTVCGPTPFTIDYDGKSLLSNGHCVEVYGKTVGITPDRNHPYVQNITYFISGTENGPKQDTVAHNVSAMEETHAVLLKHSEISQNAYKQKDGLVSLGFADKTAAATQSDNCPSPTKECMCGITWKCCNSNETCVCQGGPAANLPKCAQ